MGMLELSGSPTFSRQGLQLSRDSSAAGGTACPMWKVERDLSVPISYGVASVSRGITRIDSVGTLSTPRRSAR